MSKAKISIAGVLALMAAVGYGFVAFLSQNYLKLGNTKSAVFTAALMMLALYVLVVLAKSIKKAHNNFKTMIMVERLLVLIYIVLSFYFIKPFSHFFHVYTKKDGIQRSVLADIQMAEGMYGDYEYNANSRISKYKIRLQGIISTKKLGFNPPEYDVLQFDPSIDNQQAATLVNVFKGRLFPPDYQPLKQADSIWLMLAKENIENWSPIKVIDVVNNLDKNINQRIIQLRGYMAFTAIVEDTSGIAPFNPQFSFTNVQSKFKKQGQPGVLAVGIGLILSLLMLLDYFVTDRDFRNQQTFFGLKMGKENKNGSTNKYKVEI